MRTTLLFVDDTLEELDQTVLIGMSVKETLDMIEKASEFRVGEDGNLHSKTGWIGVDFKNHTVELMVKET